MWNVDVLSELAIVGICSVLGQSAETLNRCRKSNSEAVCKQYFHLHGFKARLLPPPLPEERREMIRLEA